MELGMSDDRNPWEDPDSDEDYLNLGGSVSEQIESAYEEIGITRAHYVILTLLLLGVFFDSLEQNAIGITGPVLREYWGLGTGDIGFLNTITFTMTAVGRLLTGAFIDRYGRKKLLMANLVVFAGGSLLCALAPSYAILAFGRGIVGFGLGGEIAVAVVMASEYFSIRDRGRAVGLINVTAAGFGNMLAPAFGVLVYTMFPGGDRWRWVFGLLFVPVLLVIYFRRYVPETPRFLMREGNVRQTNLIISRLAEGQLQGDVHVTEYVHPVASGEPGDFVPVVSSRWDIFRGRYLKRTVVLCLAVACSYAAQFAVLTLMTTILVSSGYTVNTSLWFTLLMQSGSLAGALAATAVAGALPRKQAITIAAVIGLLAAGSLALFYSAGIAVILLSGWVFNFSVIICNTTIWLFAPENYPTRIRGFGTAFILAVGSLSGGLSPLIAGKIFDAQGLGSMFGVLSVLFVIIIVVIRFIPETFGRPMEEDDELVGSY